MSNLIFSSCSSYAASMTSSSSLIFLYPSHLKSCPCGLKNSHQAFFVSSHIDIWSHSGLQLPHPGYSGSGVNSLRCCLLHQTLLIRQIKKDIKPQI